MIDAATAPASNPAAKAVPCRDAMVAIGGLRLLVVGEKEDEGEYSLSFVFLVTDPASLFLLMIL